METKNLLELLEEQKVKKLSTTLEKIVFEMEQRTHYSVGELKEFCLNFMRLHQGVGSSAEQLLESLKNLILASYEADTQTEEALSAARNGIRYSGYLNYIMREMKESLLVKEQEMKQTTAYKSAMNFGKPNRAARRAAARNKKAKN